jgi:hypothetical protein
MVFRGESHRRAGAEFRILRVLSDGSGAPDFSVSTFLTRQVAAPSDQTERYGRLHNNSPTAQSAAGREQLRRLIDLVQPCLEVIEIRDDAHLLSKSIDPCFEIVPAILQVVFNAFFFFVSQFTDVEAICDEATHYLLPLLRTPKFQS